MQIFVAKKAPLNLVKPISYFCNDKLLLMKTFLTLFLSFVFSFTTYSQSAPSIQRDTLSNQQISYSIQLASQSANNKEITISLFQVEEADTINVFEAVYSWTENDPSNFKSLIQNEQTMLFGLGNFDFGLFHAQIILRKNDDTQETFTLN